MPAPKKVPTCQNKVKGDDLSIQPCGKKLRADFSCPSRRNHVLPFKTGHCSHGWHEGDNPKTPSGKHAPTCTFWMTCPCECHLKWDALFKLSGEQRIAVDNSHYSPEHARYWMPSLEERAAARLASSSPATDDAPTRLESPLPGTIPATLRRTFAPTPTGRAARGELEARVKEACDTCILEGNSIITPALLAEMIGATYNTTPPSHGAVHAIFVRWEKIGFAVIATKPTRLVSYSEDGIRIGLEGLKIRYADKKKQSPASLLNRASSSA